MVIDFKTPIFATNRTIAYISSLSELVKVKGIDYGLCDGADNKVLETALIGACDFLITGDKDLLSLENYDQVQIVSPSQFLTNLK